LLKVFEILNYVHFGNLSVGRELSSTNVPRDARKLAGTEVTFKADGSGTIISVIAVRTLMH
jgi:hypothetical protein